MDTLQFDNHTVEGLLIEITENVMMNGYPNNLDIVFEVVKGIIGAYSNRVWFIPDEVTNPLHQRPFQGYIQDFQMGQNQQVTQYGNLNQTWVPLTTRLRLRILNVIYQGEIGYEEDFITNEFLKEQKEAIIAKIAQEKEEEQIYRNLPGRLDSID